MIKIGLISRKGRDLSRVRAELSQKMVFEIETFTNAPRAVAALKNQELSALVIVLSEFSHSQFHLLQKVRNLNSNIAVAFLAPSINSEMQKRLNQYPKTIALNSEAELANLPGILIRLSQGMRVQNRNESRQSALQPATIQPNLSDSMVNACLLDLAQHGARVRSFKNNFSVGDSVRLKVPLTFVRKTYEVEAKVIWQQQEAQTSTHPTPSTLLGLKFISISG